MGSGLLYNSFGAYFLYLQNEFGWSRTLISGAFSMSRFESGFLGPIQAWLITRLGPRTVVRLGVVVFAAGFMLLSRVDSALGFYGVFLVIAVGSGLAGFLTVNIILANWFERWRARAMSLSSTGGSIAGLMVPAVAWLMSTFGWRTTALLSGVLILLVGLPIAQLMRQAPEPYGYAPDGAAPGAPRSGRGLAPTATRVSGQSRGLTAHAALHTPAFWLLTLGHTSALVAVSALQAHLIPFAVGQLEVSIEVAAGMVALLTLASVGAHVLVGAIGDLFDKRLIAATTMAGHTGALLLLSIAAHPAVAAAAAMLHGLAWGMRGPLMMAIRADYFGRRSFATIEGYASLVTTIGPVLGPLAAGFIADTVGDYRPGFVVLACITASGMLFFSLARRPALD